MRRHKRSLVLLLALVISALALTAAAVALPQTQTAAVATQAPRATQVGHSAESTIIANADFAVTYTSLGQLKKAAGLVVRGEVTQVSYLDFNSTAYTELTFRVSRCLKGDAAVGDELTIVEVGGVTTMAAVNGDKFGAPTAQDADTQVSVLLDGAPLTEVGDRCLYFLGQGSIGVVPGTYYVPMGAFQGRFKVMDAVAQRFVPAGWGQDYTSLALDENAIDQAVLRAAADN